MALTTQEVKWFKSFMTILREKGIDTLNSIALVDILLFQDIGQDQQLVTNYSPSIDKRDDAPPEDIQNAAIRAIRKKTVPAFIRPEENNEIMYPESKEDVETVDWLYDGTMIIDDTQIQEDGSGLDEEREKKVKYLYENAKNGRLYYCKNGNYDYKNTKCIYVNKDGGASIMEKSMLDIQNTLNEKGTLDGEFEKEVLETFSSSTDLNLGLLTCNGSDNDYLELKGHYRIFESKMQQIVADQKENPQYYKSQEDAKARAVQLRATNFSRNLETLMDKENEELRKNSDYTFGVMPLRSTEELGHPELNPEGVYTSFDADIKCELKHINDAMQFKGQAVRDYVQRLQNSEMFTNAIDSLNRISEQVRAYESMMQKLPEQKKEEREYLKNLINELTVPEAQKVKIEELENKISKAVKEQGISVRDLSLKSLHMQIEDLKNMDKLTHLVDVCSYLSCRKTRSTDEFKEMGNLSDELSNYMSENLPEWMPDEQVMAAAADWEIPESMEIDFDNYTNTIIQDGIHLPEMEGLTNDQKLSRIKEGLKNPDSTVSKVAAKKLGGYIEGIVTERFKSLEMNMSLYMVPLNDCVIIDGKLVSDMFMEDETSSYAYKEGQEESTKQQERQYLAEQLGKAFQKGLSVEIFLPDKDGKFAETTKLTAKGLTREGIEAKEMDGEELSQAKGKFFVKHYGNLKGISEQMTNNLKKASIRKLPSSAYANAADAVIEDMRREKAREYNIFTGGDNGQTAAEKVSELLGKVKDAQKGVWFGSPQYDNMVQAVEKLNKLTAKMAGNINSDNIEQMYEYKKALEEVREKADAYVEYKKDEENIKPKTQKRINTATDISQYADDMIRSIQRTMKQKVDELNRNEDYANDMRREYLENMNEAIKALYNKGRQATGDTALCIEDAEFVNSLHVGGMLGRTDRADSVAANWLEYYRQTHNLSTEQLLDVVYHRPEELQGMAEDYRTFMKQNAVFNSKKDKLFPTPEVKAHIQAQANFYKNWYNNLISTPIIDYFELDDEECMKQIISDSINTINCSQNEQDIRKGYIREYADAFGGLEEMNRLQNLAGIRQAVAYCADQMCNPNRKIAQRVAAKIVYGKLMEICKDKMPYEVPKEVVYIGLVAVGGVSGCLGQKFSSEELKKYFNNTASPELKGKIEATAAASMDEAKEILKASMREDEAKAQMLEDTYKKEVCAGKLYDLFLQRLSVKKAEDTYAAMHTAEGRNEFIKQAVTSKVVEKMKNNPNLINEKGGQLLDALIAEMQSKRKEEVPVQQEVKKEKVVEEPQKQVNIG